jgi:hypothetical protein
MTDRGEDYWPDGIGATAQITPITVLKEQASNLGRKTANLVEATVRTSFEGDTLKHSLYLKVPTLKDYLYKLLSVTHAPNKIYPASVVNEIQGRYLKADNLEEFR